MRKLFTFKSIRMKLIFAFSIVIILVILLGIVNVGSINKSNQDTKEIIKQDMQILVAHEQLALNMAERTGYLRGYLLYNDERYKQNFENTVEKTIELEEFVLAHDNSEKVQSLMEKKKEWGKLTDKFFHEMEKGNSDKAKVIMANEIRPIGNQLIDGFKELAQTSENKITEKGKNVIQIGEFTLWMGLIVTVVVVVLGMVTAYITANTIAKPLQRLKDRMKKIADGELSSEAIQAKGKDEVAELMMATNEMNDQLKELLMSIKSVASVVDDKSQGLNQAANEVQQGTEQVAATMEELASGAENQANHAANLASMMNDLNSTIQEVTQSSDSIEKSSKGVLAKTKSGHEIMETTNDQMMKIDQIVKNAVDRVRGLDMKTQEISKLVTVIGEVAEQTNLLALNAAIEAARAGEHGKGFAVVADEVRKLAEQVSVSLNDIKSVVNDIQTESDQVTTSLQDGYKEVENGSEQMSKTKDTFEAIYQSVTEMTDSISVVKTHFERVSDSSKEMNASVGEIAAISEESAAGIEQTSASTQQASSSMQEVTSNAKRLANLADNLKTLMQRFTI
ncbi:putative sensory transducer protein YvaQ [Virgibacillus pantothenticus]|uniref:Chemotaxis protein n=1 Tax=Virgibacillus pantothenticus TaxID=1473 RepID=A0A0L0QN97_VIRPA|nr:methyl-accepting chemotaxis protein [Virgibacillus pantothenticus]KNE19733.1 hypothetical protein AFK71_14960 [Virgibacillus pantothenticus]MBU8566227.1 methyl-accepting chemotaxis protein [Virgibacillus pantothenticus]MBU8600652.1 methyl-accepting chemotaxis protein [Virgibacillus pantothenticus]MBU8634640.1 methyl-accepting chemotaxis protein [Virgibacillus pantothenticus]MBU8640757.1 methyl-accepting chemotaxis protein [Virgibacillus pantothenticus]